ncbi:hypothetical protein TNCV_4045131 [Trichonephila clavipes]|nr:hypothetical protein TNCV_4045131 [Trichonephila clavipes]
MPTKRWCQIKAHEIHRGKKLVLRLLLSAALSTMQVTVLFGSVTPQFSGRSPEGWSRDLLPTSGEEFRLDGYLECLHEAQALLNYKYPYSLLDLNPGTTAQQPASLNTVLCGRFFKFANGAHCSQVVTLSSTDRV